MAFQRGTNLGTYTIPCGISWEILYRSIHLAVLSRIQMNLWKISRPSHKKILNLVMLLQTKIFSYCIDSHIYITISTFIFIRPFPPDIRHLTQFSISSSQEFKMPHHYCATVWTSLQRGHFKFSSQNYIRKKIWAQENENKGNKNV